MRHFPKILYCFMLMVASAGLCLAGPALDWNEDARWELQCDHTRVRLDQTLAELGAGESNQDMVMLPNGLLVRHRDRRAVNLTVLKGAWEVLRNDQLVGKVGDSLEHWEAVVGPPLKLYTNPEKVGIIHYYRASLLDLGLLVADSKVLSVMFVEPGYLESALERSGYHARP